MAASRQNAQDSYRPAYRFCCLGSSRLVYWGEQMCPVHVAPVANLQILQHRLQGTEVLPWHLNPDQS